MGQQKHQLVQMYNHQFTAAKEFYQELSSRRQCVLSSGWWWPCANYCPLQITLLSPLMISRLYPGQALAADTPWRQTGGTEADAGSGGGGALCRLYLDTGDWEQFPVFLQIPPATLNLVFSSLGPGRAQLGEEREGGGEGKLSSRASGHSEIDGAQPSSSSKSWMDPNNCLKSAQFLF